ncbi:MAG: hypothetical protein WAS27_03985 [Candidatus Saccharimonadales bacterium]
MRNPETTSHESYIGVTPSETDTTPAPEQQPIVSSPLATIINSVLTSAEEAAGTVPEELQPAMFNPEEGESISRSHN